MRTKYIYSGFALLISLLLCPLASTQSTPIDTAVAYQYFREAQTACDQDGGRSVCDRDPTDLQISGNEDRRRNAAKIDIRFAGRNYFARDFWTAAQSAAARFGGKRLSFVAKLVSFRFLSNTPAWRNGRRAGLKIQ